MKLSIRRAYTADEVDAVLTWAELTWAEVFGLLWIGTESTPTKKKHEYSDEQLPALQVAQINFKRAKPTLGPTQGQHSVVATNGASGSCQKWI